MRGMDRATIEGKVSETLEMVKLGKLGGRGIHELSGGQQQRVAVARAIVAEPLVLLLDEPFSALDFKLRKNMQLELKRLHRRLGITFIFVTHDQSEAISMSNRIVVMNRGRIEQEGTPVQIYEEPANLFVAKFVGEINVFDGIVVETTLSGLIAKIDDMRYELPNKRNFKTGDKIKVLLRPEDITVEKAYNATALPFLEGTVDELIYKGTTYDMIVHLPSGKPVFITEWFDEDAEEMLFTPGDRVHLTWFKGWEVVLSDD
jgi:spermidine/putrescine transport system ATP-binding protein